MSLSILSTATVDITPATPLSLAGYTSRSAVPYESKASPLEANILLSIDPLTVLVVIDSLFASSELRILIVEKVVFRGYQLAEGSLSLVATHTHSAPSLDPCKPALGRADHRYMNYVAQQIADSIVSECNQVQPAVEFQSSGSAQCSWNVYRRKQTHVWSPYWPFGYRISPVTAIDEKKVVNNELRYIEYRYASGQAAFIVWTWPCHPVSEPHRGTLSADFPGIVRDYFRKSIGQNIPVFYLPGFCGDIRPRFLANIFSWRERIRAPFARFFAPATAIHYKEFVESLEYCVDEARQNASCSSVSPYQRSSSERRSLPLSSFMTLSVASDLDEFEATHLQIGPLSLLLFNAEVCSPYEKLLDGSKFDFMTGYADNVFGYLPTDAQVREGGYEVVDFFPHFSLEGRFKDNIQQSVVELVRKMNAYS